MMLFPQSELIATEIRNNKSRTKVFCLYKSAAMEQQEITFQVTVQINKGMEPTRLTVIAEKNTALSPDHELVFKITRDKDSEQLAVLIRDADHCWQLLEGDMERQDVELIGAAISSEGSRSILS